MDRLSLKRKTDYGDEENMFLDTNTGILTNGNKIMKRYDSLETTPSNTHTVIELMPVQDPNKIHTNDLLPHFNTSQQQQFIELANVAFDHSGSGSFINVENILHQSHSNIDPLNSTAYAQTIWNGNDLIVLQNCQSTTLDPKFSEQHYQINDSMTQQNMLMTGNLMQSIPLQEPEVVTHKGKETLLN